MCDLMALQPNLDIQLFLVAPDERREKVEQESGRPTFAYRERPLPRVCGFLAFDKLMDAVQGTRELGLASALKAEFLKKTAVYFVDDAETAATAL
jgi:hypothetical protein